VGWYNGHPAHAELSPDLSGRHAVIIGMGNVALDVARILSKTDKEFAGSDIVAHARDALRGSQLERITIVGRRGPHQIAMTPKELGELAHLERAAPRVDAQDLPNPTADDALEPGQRKSVALLRTFTAPTVNAKPVTIAFEFFANPVALNGKEAVRSITLERTELIAGRPTATGESYDMPADLVVSCIGYRTAPIPGVPFDERLGRFANEDGRIATGLYCVGWARRGPTGTIGTNRPDGYALIEKIAADLGDETGKTGREGFDALAKARDLKIVTFQNWKKIEEAENAAARDGAPREKFVDLAAMIAASQ
ncbi:MAG: pyridine nucleotide-disulfide oxidoreductase, partial [Pontixanthobacter sp.]